ncbi:hypothetical protein IQ07DRAFT_582338 [Pyrenochaeta sp. DS3sAY3a]|nr:hypothetical protein IQ07DRAFT_582338 [Pyrenochaeta sp. DS3sAY3a]
MLPKWRMCLPRKLIIKTQSSECHENIFEIEGEVYKRLSRHQGRLVPRYFGVGDFHYGGETVRAHIIEQVIGTPLTEYTEAMWINFDIKEKISQAYKQLSQECIIHGDIEARHIFVTGSKKRLELIDFDLAEISSSKENAEMQNEIDMKVLFRNHLSISLSKPGSRRT